MNCSQVPYLTGYVFALALATNGCEASDNSALQPTNSEDITQIVEEDTRPNTLSYDGLIQPIYIEWCGDCHTGGLDEPCAGNTCFVTNYEDLFEPANPEICNDTFNVGECGLYRIEATKDPKNPENLKGKNGLIILPDDEIELLRTWVYKLGMPKS